MHWPNLFSSVSVLNNIQTPSKIPPVCAKIRCWIYFKFSRCDIDDPMNPSVHLLCFFTLSASSTALLSQNTDSVTLPLQPTLRFASYRDKKKKTPRKCFFFDYIKSTNAHPWELHSPGMNQLQTNKLYVNLVIIAFTKGGCYVGCFLLDFVLYDFFALNTVLYYMQVCR